MDIPTGIVIDEGESYRNRIFMLLDLIDQHDENDSANMDQFEHSIVEQLTVKLNSVLGRQWYQAVWRYGNLHIEELGTTEPNFVIIEEGSGDGTFVLSDGPEYLYFDRYDHTEEQVEQIREWARAGSKVARDYLTELGYW